MSEDDRDTLWRGYDQFDRWRDHRERQRAAQQQHSVYVQASTDADAQYREQVSAFRKEVQDAVHAGEPVPTNDPPPPSDSYVLAVRESQRVLEALAQEGRLLRAELASHVETAAEQRYREIVDEVRDAVGTIEAAAGEVTSILRDVRAARSAADDAAGVTVRPSRASRSRASVTAGELTALVASSESPLRVLGPQVGIHGDSVRLGLSFYDDLNEPSDGGAERRDLAALPSRGVERVHTVREA